MKALKHIYQQPFIAATGIAALIHSTWALGTLFSGHAPAVNWASWEWYEWIVPALLIAFALDVGQISTSAQIRLHGLSPARAFTFVIFAIATYYLQWLYMAVHMPLLDISPGVTGIHHGIAESLRNLAIWLIPALLPISTVSYTFSGHTSSPDQPEAPVTISTSTSITGTDDHQWMVTEAELPTVPLLEAEHEVHEARCECGWLQQYDNADSARRGLNAHQQKCTYIQESAQVVNHEIAQ